MKRINGKIMIGTGIAHLLFGLSPLAFGKQYLTFTKTYLYKISDGLAEFPIFNGKMNYEYFAAFWFVYYAGLLITIGILIQFIEEKNLNLPIRFIKAYLIIVLIGVYMIPFSGMTFFMLPHVIYMFVNRNKQTAI